jgi:HTH-type transcriptional regulator/antitoxin HipB
MAERLRQDRIRGLVGQRIRALRLQRNYSQEAVARDLGIAHSTLSSWERAERRINVEELILLAGYFGISPAALLDQDGEPGADTRERQAAEGVVGPED